MLSSVRVVVISSEQPGARMAGPALRAREWARQLAARGADVRLAVPQPPDTDLGVPVEVVGSPSARSYRRLAASADVVITQPQRVDVAAGLHRGGARVLVDLYVPSYVEYPASILAAGRHTRAERKLIERNHLETATAIDCGDGFLVASTRQRDFLLGALGQAGRLTDPPGPHEAAYPHIAVAPFGLAAEQPPDPAESAIRGRLVPADSIVCLWAGGVWNWFDPATLLAGLQAARQVEPRLRLVFLGAGHPSAAFIGQNADPLHTELAQQLIADGAVAFADQWVPHGERWAYLRDADIAVCAHFDSPETYLSFRTRFLDHLWAGLPTITTQGGVLSDELAAAGAALTVPAGSAAAWRDALLTLAADPDRRAQLAAAARALAPQYAWDRVAEPVAALVADLAAGRAGPRRSPSRVAVARYLAVAVENRLR